MPLGKSFPSLVASVLHEDDGGYTVGVVTVTLPLEATSDWYLERWAHTKAAEPRFQDKMLHKSLPLEKLRGSRFHTGSPEGSHGRADSPCPELGQQKWG